MAKAAAKQRTRTAGKLTAQGRSLKDFELLAAEEKLLEACRKGEWADIGTGKRPETMTGDNRVRPGFIRFLALGGDDRAPVHEKGVRISGAWIDGDLDLEACHCIAPLLIHRCKIAGDVIVRRATLSTFSLEGSAIHSLGGDDLTASGSIFLRGRFCASGEVRLLCARIGRELNCEGGNFEPAKGYALSCDGAQIAGSVFLDDDFRATGGVRFQGATIGGFLNCRGGIFEPKVGDALNCDEAQIAGSVYLDGGFRASGGVRLLSTRIGGNLYCEGGEFRPKEGRALSCDSAKIGGGLFFRKVGAITGHVSLTLVDVSTLVDDRASWALAPELTLDGFRYGGIAGGGPTDAAARISWLRKQIHKHLNEEFRPQPWEQLITVLREMGHDADARAVAIEKQRMLYAAGKITLILRPFHKVYGWLAGYGHEPWRTIVAMVVVWFVAGAMYFFTEQMGLMAPASPIIHADDELGKACGHDKLGIRETIWTQCGKLPQEYTTFYSYAYSLDLILPLVDLQQDKDWAPIVYKDDAKTWIGLGVFARFLAWFEILFGWGASLLLVAVLGNLVKKD